MKSGGEDDRWCILRTSGMKTLRLAQSLNDAGIEAWTPARTDRRAGRGKRRKEVIAVVTPIIPTFVFVRAIHGIELLRIAALPVSPHPAFRLLRDQERGVPLIADAGLDPLRKAEERFRQSHLKSTRRRIEPGTQVRMVKGAFAGLTGTVQHGTDKEATVNFGGGFLVKIATYLLGQDVLEESSKPPTGLAA